MKITVTSPRETTPPSSRPQLRNALVAILVDNTLEHPTALHIVEALRLLSPHPLQIVVCRTDSRTRQLDPCYFDTGHVGWNRVLLNEILGWTRSDSVGSPGLSIQSAVDELPWNGHPNGSMIVAGSGPFDAGPIDPEEALAAANRCGIRVIPIFSGDTRNWRALSWQQSDSQAYPLFAEPDLAKKLAHRLRDEHQTSLGGSSDHAA